jgi:hypothetical protein
MSTPKIWTEEKTLQTLDKMLELIETSNSTKQPNGNIQPQFISWLNVCKAMGLSYSTFMEIMRDYSKSSENPELFALKRNAIDKLLSAVTSEGATRDELNASFVKHILVQKGDLSERTENKNENYNFEVDLTKNYDSKQLSEVFKGKFKELEEISSFMEYHKNSGSVGHNTKRIATQ